MRLRNDPKAQCIINENSHFFILNPQVWKGQWKKIFQNNNDIYLEIGSGKGQFIINKALSHPKINFIGIEKNKVICAKLFKKYNLLEIKPKNLIILNIDALNLLEVFNKQEIARIFLNFSDPWPKKRHHKNRLTHKKYLYMYKIILSTNGIIELKTDNNDFFEWSLESISNEKWNIKYQTRDLYLDLNNENNHNNIPTEYEERFKKLGNKINKVIFYP